MPSAMSSFVFPSSALAAKAAFAILENAFITSGAPPRRFRKCAVSSVTVWGQSFISRSPHYPESFYFTFFFDLDHAIGVRLRPIADVGFVPLDVCFSGKGRHVDAARWYNPRPPVFLVRCGHRARDR